MAEDFKGSLWKKAPPKDVDRKGAENWIEIRRKEEGAEGLWRIHNKLYDLSSYIKIHPGGSEWLELTKVSLFLHQEK
jgi:cytochrome b involved in lipid metabolism